jgi:NADPH-dependent ferric siderophore reductase
MTMTSSTLPLLLEEVEVRRVERLSPCFVRIELGSPALAELGVERPWYDQRIKLVFPGTPGGPPPSFEGADDSWYATWLDRPTEERGHMRTYSVRDVVGEGEDTRLVIDFVLHGEGDHGPGGDWAERVAVGDRVVTLAPRAGHVYGGIEFEPGDADRLLLVGDETAVPAVAAILEQLPATARGTVFVEVPTSEDVLTLRHPDGVEVRWLPREGGPRGETMHAAVLAHLGAQVRPPAVTDDDVDPDLWETPGYSSSGEDVEDHARSVGHDWDGLYAWIAGESKVVTGLRRALVKDLGVDRHQVAFMGYWREGVAMKS